MGDVTIFESFKNLMAEEVNKILCTSKVRILTKNEIKDYEQTLKRNNNQQRSTNLNKQRMQKKDK